MSLILHRIFSGRLLGGYQATGRTFIANAHLLQDIEKIEKGVLDEEEVRSFTGILIPLLAKAMHLALKGAKF